MVKTIGIGRVYFTVRHGQVVQIGMGLLVIDNPYGRQTLSNERKYSFLKLLQELTVSFLWHQERASRIDERKKANRSEEQQTVEAGSGLLGDTEWERIISLINFNLGAQQKDTSRLRSMLFQAREVNLGATE